MIPRLLFQYQLFFAALLCVFASLREEFRAAGWLRDTPRAKTQRTQKKIAKKS